MGSNILIREMTVATYDDFNHVESEVQRLLQCEQGRAHPCMKSAAYIQFRQNALRMIHEPDSQAMGIQMTLAQKLVIRCCKRLAQQGQDEGEDEAKKMHDSTNSTMVVAQLFWPRACYEVPENPREDFFCTKDFRNSKKAH
jgi:hypothetical protein